MKKDDKLLRQISVKIPNFHVNKGVDLSLNKKSRRMFIAEHITDVTNIL